MPTDTRIIVQDATDGPLSLREVTLPDPGPHDVLLRIHATGVCQSQLYWMHAARPGPMLFGHEGYGTVVATGSAVTHVAAGDAAMITWVPRTDDRTPTRAAVDLPDGRTAHSPNVYTWAEHTLVDELYVLPLGPESRADVVSIVGCAVVTGAGALCHAAPVEAGNTVAVFGVGGVGLSAVAAASIRGASRIVAVDLDADKLAFAKQFGATDTIDASITDNPSATILELTGGVDIAVDCVGHSSTTVQALDSVRAGRVGGTRGGTVVLVGLPKGPTELNLAGLIGGQKQLVGTSAGGCTQDDIEAFLQWHTDGRLDLDALVTDRYPLADIDAAVGDLASGRVLGRAIVTM
ncbi:zinc-binding dehydrogenase [Prescottella defluvii]|uniref:zinc-binding dehydrogenase n=1 Tax=Prescottella defluvii TaxID=1323361 RepID=UPI0009DF0098|nr:zinc-binding dehydrogenase [Prescottella defluvii]